MRRKIFKAWIIFFFLFTMRQVHAASTCDYTEQVSLSHLAATVNATYEIRHVLVDDFGNVVEENETTKNNALYTRRARLYLQVLNLSDDLYLTIEKDNDFNSLANYYYRDTVNGNLEILVGDLSRISNYSIVIYSNSERCLGDKLRTIKVVTPMYNSYHEMPECAYIPEFDYCQEYITTAFLSSSSTIKSTIADAYVRYLDSNVVPVQEEEESFQNKFFDFIEKYKMVIVGILVAIFLIIVIIIIVILEKRRKALF